MYMVIFTNVSRFSLSLGDYCTYMSAERPADQTGICYCEARCHNIWSEILEEKSDGRSIFTLATKYSNGLQISKWCFSNGRTSYAIMLTK